MPYFNTGVQLPIASTPKLDDMEQELEDVHNSLYILAGMLGSYQAVEGDATLDEASFIVIVKTTATVTLPSVDEVIEGKRYYIKAAVADEPVTIAANGSELIDGTYSSVAINFPQSAKLVSDGVGWWII